ncbi:MAG: potassium channel family protein [Chitinophagales bacterium]|nr:two pore domain potassium channel family protein [Bacteroidota bacterium]MCB9226316.1 two pore domain potassium channel family protein [Chitinophagales bacterium]
MLFDKNSFFRSSKNRGLIIATILTLSVGTVFYHFIEKWNWLDSFYFSVITLTTVGYGDFSPQTNAGKIFTVFYVIMGIGLVLAFINEFYDHRINNKDKK